MRRRVLTLGRGLLSGTDTAVESLLTTCVEDVCHNEDALSDDDDTRITYHYERRISAADM